MTTKKSSMFVIFTTVLVDLIGFGMVIPLVALYGKHYQATSFELAVLASIYSLMQFFATPVWGALSDRVGRRPVILFSLFGSFVTYLLFGLADSYAMLLFSRAVGGICAANISAAQAYIADITPSEKRAHGMGIIGAAFGIGFTLGPPIGGICSNYLGLSGPGLVAAAITGVNFLVALFRLPESLSDENRSKARALFTSPIDLKVLSQVFSQKKFSTLLTISFFVVFAFSHMEQSFSLLFQTRFNLQTEEAGLWAGYVLAWSGIVGALIQGGLIRVLLKRFNEPTLLSPALMLYALSLTLYPFWPSYSWFFLGSTLLAMGSGVLNPSLASLISKSAGAHEQGKILGLNQSLGSLARVLGPFCALPAFGINYALPFVIAGSICFLLSGFFVVRKNEFAGKP